MDNPIIWAIFTALIGLCGWVGKIALAFGRMEGRARSAEVTAAEARKETIDFNLGLTALNAAFNLFQVQAAEKYITRAILSEFESRLTEVRRETTETIRGDIKDLRTRVEVLSKINGNGNGRRPK